MNKKLKIGVLLTCHNRKSTTVECLEAVMNLDKQNGTDLDIFLVDDGSTDGTKEAVEENFPNVNTILGSGDLFWNKGMQLAWRTAIKSGIFDFYLWLNDDTLVDSDALLKIFQDYSEAKKLVDNEVLITAACRKKANVNDFSYGGRNDDGPVLPNGTLQSCKYINGNLVLIPRTIMEKIGILSNNYTHALGDYDYGLRAIKNGFTCFTTKTYVATCPPNIGVPGWSNPHNSLKKRWKLFHSPQGLNIKEYIRFRKDFWGSKWMIFALKAYLKTIFPSIYERISRI